MTQFFLDNFNEASSVGLASHAPDIGGAYSAYSGGALVGAGDGKVNFISGEVTTAAANVTPGSANYTVTGTISMYDVGSRLDLSIRSATNSYFVYCNFGGTLELQKWFGGGATMLDSDTLSGGFTGGADYPFSFSVNGTSLSFTIGGVTLTATDSSIASAGTLTFGGRSIYYKVIEATDDTGGDVTAPTITGPGGATGSTSSISVAENTTTIHTFTANETVTWSLNGGADVAFFSINSSTGALTFATGRDFEAPADAGANNTYVVGVRATDTSSNATTQTLTVTITDVSEGSAIGAIANHYYGAE